MGSATSDDPNADKAEQGLVVQPSASTEAGTQEPSGYLSPPERDMSAASCNSVKSILRAGSPGGSAQTRQVSGGSSGTSSGQGSRLDAPNGKCIGVMPSINTLG